MKNKFLGSCILSLVIVAAPISLQANMVTTNQMLVSEHRSSQIALIETFMAREEVRNQLQSMGVDASMATKRVADMTDSQLQQLAQNIQNMPAGGSALGLIAVVLVIIILLEILGVTNLSNKI